jgi:hypothetical protein
MFTAFEKLPANFGEGTYYRLYKLRLNEVRVLFVFHGATDPSGPGPPHYRGFTITLIQTHQTR